MSRYSKFFAAIGTAITVAVTVTADGDITIHDALLIVEAFVGALAVWAVKNTPA